MASAKWVNIAELNWLNRLETRVIQAQSIIIPILLHKKAMALTANWPKSKRNWVQSNYSNYLKQSLRQKNTEISNLQKRITIATNAKCKKSLPCTPNSPGNISNKYSNPVQLKLTNNITNCSRMSALFDGPTTPLSNLSFSPKLPFKDSPSNVSTTLWSRNDTLSPSNVPRMTRNDTLSPSNVTMLSGNTSVSVTTVDNTVYNSQSIASLFSGNSSEDFGSFPDTEPIPANVNQKRTKFTIEPHIIKHMKVM